MNICSLIISEIQNWHSFLRLFDQGNMLTCMTLVCSIVNKRTVLENEENISPDLLVHIRGLHMFDLKNEHG